MRKHGVSPPGVGFWSGFRVYEQHGSEWQHFMAGSGYTNVLQDLHKCGILLPQCQLPASNLTPL